MRIYCPKCGWQPDRDAEWYCPCPNVWNTFETRGVCPRCNRRWKDTQCLSCHAWSPHEDWYHDGEPEETRRGVRTRRKVRKKEPA